MVGGNSCPMPPLWNLPFVWEILFSMGLVFYYLCIVPVGRDTCCLACLEGCLVLPTPFPNSPIFLPIVCITWGRWRGRGLPIPHTTPYQTRRRRRATRVFPCPVTFHSSLFYSLLLPLPCPPCPLPVPLPPALGGPPPLPVFLFSVPCLPFLTLCCPFPWCLALPHLAGAHTPAAFICLLCLCIYTPSPAFYAVYCLPALLPALPQPCLACLPHTMVVFGGILCLACHTHMPAFCPLGMLHALPSFACRPGLLLWTHLHTQGGPGSPFRALGRLFALVLLHFCSLWDRYFTFCLCLPPG